MKSPAFKQKLWRFCSNRRVKETTLIEPMHEAIRRETVERPDGVLLAVHDWSTLSFGHHPSKTDRATLTHEHDLGYDLATVLMVRAADGAPIAPAVVSLEAAETVHSVKDVPHALGESHVDQILGNMTYVREQGFGAPMVHVIDREADSVNHWRQWSAAGHVALVRADNRIVLHQGEETTLEKVADGLRAAGSLKYAREVRYRGRRAYQYVGEAPVTLHRPGKRNTENGKKIDVPGPPLGLRLVVSEIRDAEGRLLARWLLLTNASEELADAATVALWYYFRWRIESLHKLIKSSGWQLESWLQRDARRILIKLLIAFGAAASIWALERREDAESKAFQELLMHLSGRQTKRTRRVTTSGLLAGLWVLQAAVGPLARHGADRLNAMLENHLPLFAVNK